MSLHGSGDLLDYADHDPSIASRKTDRDAFVRERNYIYTWKYLIQWHVWRD